MFKKSKNKTNQMDNKHRLFKNKKILLNTNNVTVMADTHKIKFNLTYNVNSY